MLLTIGKGMLFAAVATGILSVAWILIRNRIGSLTRLQKLACLALTFWSMLVIYMTLLTFACDPPVYETGFTPLHTLREIYVYGQYDLSWQLVFNIAMFMPFGFLLPVIFREMRSASMVMTVGLLLTTCIECTQLFIGRSFDIDDILCNTLGAILGYGLYVLTGCACHLLRKQKISRRSKVISFLTGLELLLMILYPVSFYL